MSVKFQNIKEIILKLPEDKTNFTNEQLLSTFINKNSKMEIKMYYR